MRLISFEQKGRSSFGIATDRGIIDARERLGTDFGDLRGLLEADAVDSLREIESREIDYGYDDIQFRPVIDNPAAKILCVGINYMPHIREMGRERPDYPVIFVRFLDSLVGHQESLLMPRESEKFDFEGELAVVIGRRARRVPASAALNYVAGFSCFNDGSVRDYQRHGPQWTPGKNFHKSGSFGPWMVTRDEQPDPAALQLKTVLNGEVVQQEAVAELCFDVPKLIEYISIWTQLEPGDVIVSGTPGGVGAGRTPPLWMSPGDVVEVEIEGLGTLRNTISAENAD